MWYWNYLLFILEAIWVTCSSNNDLYYYFRCLWCLNAFVQLHNVEKLLRPFSLNDYQWWKEEPLSDHQSSIGYLRKNQNFVADCIKYKLLQFLYVFIIENEWCFALNWIELKMILLHPQSGLTRLWWPHRSYQGFLELIRIPSLKLPVI